MPTPTKEQKFNFLRRVYFGVTNNPDDDVNPYIDLNEFGDANVGSLRWGFDAHARQRSKVRFSNNYYSVLRHYRIILKVEDIYSELDDDNENNNAVNIWVEKAVFPNQ